MNIDFIESLTRFKLDGENAVQLKTVGELISPHLDTVLERFYAGVQQDDSAVSFFTGGAPQMSRARSAQKAHWMRLLNADFGAEYQESVRRIGATHARIELPLELYMSAYSCAGSDLLACLMASKTRRLRRAHDLGALSGALMRAFAMDMALVGDEITRIQSEEQTRAFGYLNAAIDDLAQGDLTHVIPGPEASDFPVKYDPVRIKLNSATEGLKQTITRIGATVADLLGAVDEVATGSDELSRRTENQAASLEQTAAAMQELSQNVASSATDTQTANSVAQSATNEMTDGVKIVSKTSDAMGRIQDASDRISQIIGLIDDVAFQTNLLALNAGVEAARAGDAGRGFSVVASEVRSLAGSTSEAAKEIKQLIQASAMEVETGVRLTEEAGATFDKIVASFAEVSKLSSNVASAMREQSEAVQEVNSAVTHIDGITQENASMVQNTTMAADVMRRCGQDVQSLLKNLRLERTQDVFEYDMAG